MVAARGRKAQLGLALQVFGARVKVAVRRDKRTYLQENLDRVAEAADNGNVDEVYRLLKPWVKPRYRALPCVKLDNGQWARTPNEAAQQRRRQSRDKSSRVLRWRLVERSVLSLPLSMRCLISFFECVER